MAAEEALRLSEARYRVQIEHAPEAIVVYDVDEGRFIEANGNAERLFGRTREELARLDTVALSPPLQPDGRPSTEVRTEQIESALAGGSPVYEWLYRDASGRDIPCEVRLVRLPAAGRRIIRGSIIDITERKRLEELRARAAELEFENRRIQEASRLKSEFIANMSHELRTPLNAMIGFAEVLHDGQVDPRSPQHHEFLRHILTSSRHLLELISDILDLAKIEAGKLELRSEPIRVDSIIEEVCAILRTGAAAKRLKLEVEVDPAVREVVGDPARFKQILYNYLSNAIKFTQDEGRVVVRALAAGPDGFRLEVEDTGIGIAPSDMGRLFAEFQQLDEGRAKRHPGTGLGLALTKRLVEAHGGTVGVASEPGRGSTFHAVLPRRAPGAPAAGPASAGSAGGAGSAASRPRPAASAGAP
jgi:PAS domain S-box-containing protein